jgi:hypothetical protein
MAGFGSFRFPRFAEITSSKHLTLAPRGNHAGGSILAAKMAQVLAAVDSAPPFGVGDTRACFS